MPRLKNEAHETFVQTYLTHPEKKFNQTFAYKSAFPEASQATAEVEGHRVMTYPAVQNRLIEVFDKSGISDERIAEKLNELLENPKGAVQLGAVRTILEVRKDIETSSKLGLQVNISDDRRVSILNLMKVFLAA